VSWKSFGVEKDRTKENAGKYKYIFQILQYNTLHPMCPLFHLCLLSNVLCYIMMHIGVKTKWTDPLKPPVLPRGHTTDRGGGGGESSRRHPRLEVFVDPVFDKDKTATGETG
jgi:hypothetical protein